MNKLALSDEILLNIDKPARYIGHEVNAVMKDKEKVEVRFAKMFPPFYTDFGKNITIGRRVFINAGCHFQDHVLSRCIRNRDVPSRHSNPI